MPASLIVYDPQRIDALRRAATVAHDHLLRAPRVDDPHAAGAEGVARVARSHLEHGWLPTLTRVAASRAMAEFDASGPAVIGATFGFGRSLSPPPPGPPRAIPVSWGSSNAEARAAAEAAVAAGEPGRFVGRTQTYEVIETPPSTSIPSSGHDPDGGSGSYDALVEDHWLYEHNLATPPAPFGATPVGGWMSLLARLARLAQDDADTIAHQRGLAYEELCKEARGPGGKGGIADWRNVAVFRLTTTEGDDLVVQEPVVSGDAERDGYLGNPVDRKFQTDKDRENDTEVKILEDVAQRLAPSDDAVVEIFTELPPCPSCQKVIAQFHARFPNVQVRVYYRGTEVQVN